MPTVIVTGATSGFGLATAKKFKENGYKVIITARNENKLKEIQKEINADYYFVQDVTGYGSWKNLLQFTKEKFGKLDVLINNAGGGLNILPIEEHTEKTIRDIIDLNLNSVIFAANVFVPLFKEQKCGTIVNIASVCATHAWADWSVYASAKAGVLNFTKGLQTELQPYGVRATCVIPASASTGFQKAANIGATHDSLSVNDIAQTVYFVSTLPNTAICEDITVWGMSQMVQPL